MNQHSKHPLTRTQWFKNLLAQIWYFNTKKCKILFAQAKSSRFSRVGYRYIMANMLTKELTKKILYQTVITIEVLLSLFFIYILDARVFMIYVHKLKIKLLKSKLPVSSCSRSQYLGIVTSYSSASQASCRVSFPPCCSHAEVARILFTLIFPDLCLEEQNLSSQPPYNSKRGVLQ